jgi:hypothetical protein
MNYIGEKIKWKGVTYIATLEKKRDSCLGCAFSISLNDGIYACSADGGSTFNCNATDRDDTNVIYIKLVSEILKQL